MPSWDFAFDLIETLKSQQIEHCLFIFRKDKKTVQTEIFPHMLEMSTLLAMETSIRKMLTEIDQARAKLEPKKLPPKQKPPELPPNK